MILSLQHASKTYTKDGVKIHALADASLELAAGDFVAVEGPSGCGKSTLLLISGGLLAPSEGKGVVCGEDVYAMSPGARAAFRARNIGFVFQQFHLIPYLSVRENVLAAGLAAREDHAGQRADELIERFGLAARMNHLPSELSTGERQRTALARALLHRPKLILADEPTGNLDPDNARIVLDDLAALARDGAAVLLVTHEEKAAAYAGRRVRLVEGAMVAAEDGEL